MSWSVGEVARFARVSVRTLHHYDELGLLVPSARTGAGHRRYSGPDLDRLQRILGYRALGFALERITEVLDQPDLDAMEHLRCQRNLLMQRDTELHRQLALLDKTMEAHQMGIRLTPMDMFEVFGDEDPTQHVAEVEQRWGQTDAFAESQRRTSTYGKQDWTRMKEEGEAVEQRLADLMTADAPPGGAEAMAAAEAHRQHISAWFYDCPPAAHRGLAEMYVANERFAAHYDTRAPGLAAYVHSAILANADRSE